VRFISHSTNERLMNGCRERGVSFAAVERGYGIGAIRRALERYLVASAPSDRIRTRVEAHLSRMPTHCALAAFW
jgi:hypothetical protein